ncbi:hypothetical protein ACHAXM_003069 [Skeletonema potamos]
MRRKRKSSDSSNSDEESVEAAEPPEEELFSSTSDDVNCIRTLFLEFGQGKVWWVQCITIFVAAFLAYSYDNAGSHSTNVQISIMTAITIVGASPFCKSHLVPTAIGALVGGQNVIAALTDNENTIYATNYLWLLLLSAVVGLVWCFVITPFKILDGFGGRLGTTTFIGMNITMILFFGPLGVVQWERYIFGFCISVIWLGVAGGAIRIAHNRYIRHLEQMNMQPPEALNNVLIPSVMALTSMILVNATAYKHASGLYNGFAVGAYVAMASLQKIPNIEKFTLVSCTAAIWGLALTPFFVGFPGSKSTYQIIVQNALQEDLLSCIESGFTAMMGHTTFESIERLMNKSRQQRVARRRQVEDQMRLAIEIQQRQQQQEEEEKSFQTATSNSHDEAPPLLPYHPHSHKPQRENSVLLKHQRRQQSRLRHYQDDDQTQGGKSKLQHRGWSAIQADTSDRWQHTLESQQENNNNVV